MSTYYWPLHQCTYNDGPLGQLACVTPRDPQFLYSQCSECKDDWYFQLRYRVSSEIWVNSITEADSDLNTILCHNIIMPVTCHSLIGFAHKIFLSFGRNFIKYMIYNSNTDCDQPAQNYSFYLPKIMHLSHTYKHIRIHNIHDQIFFIFVEGRHKNSTPNNWTYGNKFWAISWLTSNTRKAKINILSAQPASRCIARLYQRRRIISSF